MLNRLISRYLWVEPLKPLLCHDARCLTLWMCDKEFTLDPLNNLPRCVAEYAYTTVPEMTNLGWYDNIILTENSNTFSGSTGFDFTIKMLFAVVGIWLLLFVVWKGFVSIFSRKIGGLKRTENPIFKLLQEGFYLSRKPSSQSLARQRRTYFLISRRKNKPVQNLNKISCGQ